MRNVITPLYMVTARRYFMKAVLHHPLKIQLALPIYFRNISVHSGRNVCTQGLLYVRNGDVLRFYAITYFS